MKQPPCRCGYLSFPHRYQATGKRGCYEYVSRDDYEEQGEPFDDVERRLDERERARYVNELNRGAAK